MKLIKIGIFLITLTFFNSYAKAEKNLDCSKYSTKSFTGLINNIKCKKGILQRKNLWSIKESVINLSWGYSVPTFTNHSSPRL